MMHDSSQIAQSAAAEENDSLIFETLDAILNNKPANIEIQGKATLPISGMLLIF